MFQQETAAATSEVSTRMPGMRRLLIVGCGDVGLRILPLLRGRYRLYALTHSRERHDELREQGVTPLSGDLDDPQSLVRLCGLPHDLLHFAPPPSAGARDVRTGNLIRALRKARSIHSVLYTSVPAGCMATAVDASWGSPRRCVLRPIARAGGSTPNTSCVTGVEAAELR